MIAITTSNSIKVNAALENLTEETGEKRCKSRIFDLPKKVF